jgi:hypothetical protein
MGRIGTYFAGIITGFAVCFVANHYHVVRADSGVFVVPKLNQNLDDIYVDIRGFGLSDWQEHRMLAASLLQSDRQELLDGTALTGFRKSIVSLVNQWTGE